MCIEIADYIIIKINEMNQVRAGQDRIRLSCKRLQKLIYFSEVRYMQLNNGKQLFEDNYYAWPSGPVVPEIYYTYVEFQTGEMLPLDEHSGDKLEPNIKIIIKDLLYDTINMSTEDLIRYSHVKNGPWAKHIYNEGLITKEEIFSFYKGREIFVE